MTVVLVVYRLVGRDVQAAGGGVGGVALRLIILDDLDLSLLSQSLRLSKCYPSYRLNGVNRYTASGQNGAPHQPVNHHTTVTKATVAGAGSDPSHKSVEE